jgi:hypothetical protein
MHYIRVIGWVGVNSPRKLVLVCFYENMCEVDSPRAWLIFQVVNSFAADRSKVVNPLISFFVIVCGVLLEIKTLFLFFLYEN